MKIFFDKAWSELKLIYDEGSICSERHMQCELFKLLTIQADFNNDYRIFVEPRISDPDIVIPDFIITDKNHKVKAVVELKYVPHFYSKYDKDLKVLMSFIIKFQKDPDYGFKLLTDPKTGEWKNEMFKFDKSLILIHCVVTKADAFMITNNREIWQSGDNFDNGKFSYLQYVGAIPANSDEDWGQINSVPPSGG